MKLSAFQTTEELSLLDNIMYKGIAYKLSSLFTTKQHAELKLVTATVPNDSSQFYKKQVELAGTGKRAKATVLYITETGLLINEDPVISLTLRFHHSKKSMLEITAKTVVSRRAVPKAADIITIAYNTKDLSMIAVL